MTANQVSPGMADDLLASDSCTIEIPPDGAPSVGPEPHTPEPHSTQFYPPEPHTSPTRLCPAKTPGSHDPTDALASTPLPSLDETTDIPTTDVQNERETVCEERETVCEDRETVYEESETVHDETESGNVFDSVLAQPPVQIISLEKDRFSEADVDDVNVRNGSEIGGVFNPNQTGDKVTKEVGRSQPVINIKCDTCDNTKATESTKGSMELVVPENVVLQDAVAEDCRSSCVLESSVSSKTTPSSWVKKAKHHNDTSQTVTQSMFIQRDMDGTSQPFQYRTTEPECVRQAQTVCDADTGQADITQKARGPADPEISLSVCQAPSEIREITQGDCRERGHSSPPEVAGSAGLTLCDPGVIDALVEITSSTVPGVIDALVETTSSTVPGVTDALVEITSSTVPGVTDALVEITSSTVPGVTDALVEITSSTVPGVTDALVEITSSTVPGVTDALVEITSSTVPGVIGSKTAGRHTSCETQQPEERETAGETIPRIVSLIRDMRGETVCSSDEKHIVGVTADNRDSESGTITRHFNSHICCFVGEVVRSSNGVGAGQDTDVVGVGQDTDVVGACQNTDVVGVGQDTDVVGACQDTDVVGVGQDIDVVSAGQDTDVFGVGQDIDVVGAGQDTDVVGSGQDTDVVGAGQDTDVASGGQDTDCVLKDRAGEALADLNNVSGESVLMSESDSCDVIHQDLTVGGSSLNYVNQMSKISVTLDALGDFPVKQNEAEAVCDTSVIRRPASPVCPAHFSTNNTLGCIDDSTLISDHTLPNFNSSPEDTLAHTSVLAQSPMNLVELDSRELICSVTDPHTTLRFSTWTFHPPELTDVSSSGLVWSVSEQNSSSHLLVSGSQYMSNESPATGGVERPVLLAGTCYTPDAAWDLGCISTGREADHSGARDVMYGSEPSSDDLWLDACQFLACEEDEGSVLVESECSPAICPYRADLDHPAAVGLPAGTGGVLGQWAGEPEPPPVESWSSSDSWASALSDWFPSSSIPPEDSSSWGLAKGQPQCPPEGEKGSPVSPSDTGHPAGAEPGPQVRTHRDNPNGLRQQRADKDVDDGLHAHSRTARSQHPPEEPAVALKEEKMEVEAVSHYSGGLTNECGTQLESDALWEGTNDRTFQLFSDVEEEGERNYGPLRVSGYSSDRNSKSGWDEEQSLIRSPYLHTHTHTLLNLETEHLTHAHILLDSEPEHLTHTHTHVARRDCHGISAASSLTEDRDSRVCVHTHGSGLSQEAGRADETSQIMPFTPVSLGTAFLSPPLKEKRSGAHTSPGLSGVPEENTADFPGGSRSGNQLSDARSARLREQSSSTSGSDSDESSSHDSEIRQEADDIRAELSKLILLTGQRFMVSKEKRIAYVTLDLDDVPNCTRGPGDLRAEVAGCRAPGGEVKPCSEEERKTKMPHKAAKAASEDRACCSRPRQKSSSPRAGLQDPNMPDINAATVTDTIVVNEKTVTPNKPQGKKKKKKKKHAQNVAPTGESAALVEAKDGAKSEEPKPQSKGGEAASLLPKAGYVGEKPDLPLLPTSLVGGASKAEAELEAGRAVVPEASKSTADPEPLSTRQPDAQDDDLIKRRRICDGVKAVPIRTRPQLPAIFRQRKEDEDGTKRSDIIKHKIQPPKEVPVPRVLAEIQVAPLPGDTQSISLWCQFSSVPTDTFITWTKEGAMLSEEKRRVGDDSRVSVSIVRACSKDLGLYRCSLTSLLGSVCTADYHLTSEVLMEFVIPSHEAAAEFKEVEGEEEDVFCTPLLFKDSILTDQYFGENQPASIVTEKTHFGEGMHRKAFRTRLRAGMEPTFSPGHSCVLKVHNTIGYGTKNNQELTQRNYDLAVEECFVQNTAREYIKAYTNIAKSAETFGEVPEIIPIYLVHRPSSEIPYATLEEELIGDFVKYSVKDGKEINLTRRDSESGQKCCTFQHWVYEQTDGNLLITDMQGVGMKLTDVGIATSKKGYKGFRGNCATSFIDQFKVLHQCTRFCELLGLRSLQPKPKSKRTVAPARGAKPQPNKQPCGPVLKGKS